MSDSLPPPDAVPAAAPLPYGAWPSPISAADLVVGSATPTDVWVEGGTTWWSQTRPDQGGRTQLQRRDADGTVHDVLPGDGNARTRVHEYGGGSWWVHDGVVFATEWVDQRLYRIERDAVRRPITAEPARPHALRYADGRLTPDGRTVICVRERHEGPEAVDVYNELVALDAHADAGAAVLFGRSDFVAAPRISPDGRWLAWLAWDHPDMPWDATTLMLGELVGSGAGARLESVRVVAGGREADEALVQSEWGPDGTLYVISDRSDWWNVYRVDEPTGAGRLEPVQQVDAEVGRPAWIFGLSRYLVDAEGTVWMTYSDAGGAQLVGVNPSGVEIRRVTPGPMALNQLRWDAGRRRIVAIASWPDSDASIVAIETDSPPTQLTDVVLHNLRPGVPHQVPAGLISRPQRISFPSTDGRTAYGWLYLPTGRPAPPGELPPLLVSIHGGPTASADPSFRPAMQYWTTRGFALVDVDYGGSTGLGRRYRRLLDGAWGIVDVDDACAAATWLADQGLVDGERLAIRGGSAGGFTTLAALAERDVFAVGASHFGVADLGALARDTHKFESRYLDRLVGPWPEAADIYQQRSPLTHADGFDRPLIVLQGDQDAIVPPAQAEVIVAALKAKGVPHAYLLFEGEQHGFRIAENIIRAMESELSFYAQVFGFTPAGEVPPVPIEFADRL